MIKPSSGSNPSDLIDQFVNTNWDDIKALIPYIDQFANLRQLQGFGEASSVNTNAIGSVPISFDYNVHILTLTGNISLSFTDIATDIDVSNATIILKQNAIGGHVPTFPGSVLWPGGSTPSFTTTANAIDIVSLITEDNGTSFYGVSGGLNFS